MNLSDLPWPDVPGGKVIIITGSLEQHGPHLPLNTDLLIAEAVATKVAETIGAVVGPTIPAGISPEHIGFPGTVTLDEDTFRDIVSEVADSLRKHGFNDIIIINGHGGNNMVLDSLDIGARVVNLTGLMRAYDHAGEVETSLILHIRPGLVHKGEIKKHDFRWPGKKGWKDTRDFSISGVLGDPTAASIDKGKEYLDALVKETVEQLRHT
jgi:creatinine amidohydrolase/Fe(II)-dependent formamide hydrolase-like protein